jgi:predicted nucleotidyltransferase
MVAENRSLRVRYIKMDSGRRKTIREVVGAAHKDPDVLALLLYGSAARGENSATSDIDLCLVLRLRVRSALELSQKKLEYTARFPFHISIFQQLPLYVRQRVLRDGKVLYCRDTNTLYDVAFITIRDFADFEHIYLDYLKEVADVG